MSIVKQYRDEKDSSPREPTENEVLITVKSSKTNKGSFIAQSPLLKKRENLSSIRDSFNP